MWPLCTANSFLWLLLPLLIGLLTGWWAWAKHRGANADIGFTAPVAASEPIKAPEPVVPAPPVARLAEVPPVTVDAPPISIPDVPPVQDAPVVPAAAALTAIGIPAAVGAPDSLLQIKGVGPKLNALLTSLGVTRFDQIAAWGSEEIAKVDAHLGAFKGRIVRDNWIEQAKLLASGAIKEFEAKFGALDSENKR